MDHHEDTLQLSRREVLIMTAAACGAAAATALPADADDASRGTPFDDGSLFDDGFGWVA